MPASPASWSASRRSWPAWRLPPSTTASRAGAAAIAKPFSLVRLPAYLDDTDLLDGRRSQILKLALRALQHDPLGALGYLPIEPVERPGGWHLYVATLPLGIGDLVYEVDRHEQVIVLHRVLWAAGL